MNVLQRMGPMAAPRTAVTPLDRRVPATAADAAALRRAFGEWIAPLTDPDTADDLTLAVYEALANVVDHAYRGSAEPGVMNLRAVASQPLLGGRDIVVTVTDEGTWLHTSGDPGWRGRGLPLMRRLTHSTSVVTSSGGTAVAMRRRVTPEFVGV